MAKGRSRSGTRDPSESLTQRLRSRPITISPASRSFTLSDFDDLRTFDFEPGTRPARLFSGSVASVGAVAPTKRARSRTNFAPVQMAFTAPAQTLVCVRRSRRREVLHALKKTGKGGQRRPRRSRWSDYKC